MLVVSANNVDSWGDFIDGAAISFVDDDGTLNVIGHSGSGNSCLIVFDRPPVGNVVITWASPWGDTWAGAWDNAARAIYPNPTTRVNEYTPAVLVTGWAATGGPPTDTWTLTVDQQMDADWNDFFANYFVAAEDDDGDLPLNATANPTAHTVDVQFTRNTVGSVRMYFTEDITPSYFHNGAIGFYPQPIVPV